MMNTMSKCTKTMYHFDRALENTRGRVEKVSHKESCEDVHTFLFGAV